MAYPEPIPELRGKKAKGFLHRLNHFKLTKAQKKFFEGATDLYHKIKPHGSRL